MPKHFSHIENDPFFIGQLRAMLRPEIKGATDPHDLQRRLARLGYRVRRKDGQQYLATLPHGALICRCWFASALVELDFTKSHNTAR